MKDLFVSGYGYSYWIVLLSEKVQATRSGLFLVFGMDDCGNSYHLYRLNEGDNIFENFGPEGHGQWWSNPVAFKHIPDYDKEAVGWKPINIDSNKYPIVEAPFTGVYALAYKIEGADDIHYMLSKKEKGENILPIDYYGLIDHLNLWDNLMIETQEMRSHKIENANPRYSRDSHTYVYYSTYDSESLDWMAGPNINNKVTFIAYYVSFLYQGEVNILEQKGLSPTFEYFRGIEKDEQGEEYCTMQKFVYKTREILPADKLVDIK